MTRKRGEVVIVDWPHFQPQGTKRTTKPRPALVIQNNKDNSRLTNTILAMISSSGRRTNEPTQVVVEIATPHGQQTGLRQDSVVSCINLLTVEQSRILHTIGTFSSTLMQDVNNGLKVALDLP
ncbi:MAG: type II toxin-antitoxin system PemK/MazF family toxin [Planctomycetes bacterium]|nr:type II toxin-antitoxin system PemK/MazF family toxin [Planctomycetota bacterium]